MEKFSHRFHTLASHKRKPEFANPRRKFELDRIIHEYEAENYREDHLKIHEQGTSEVRPVFSLEKSIKVLPMTTDVPQNNYKRQLRLKSLEPYANSQEGRNHLKLKAISTRYNRTPKECKREAQSTELQAKKSHSLERGKEIFENLRLRARSKQNSLISLQSHKVPSSTRSKSKERVIKWGHRTRKGYNPNDPHKPNQDEYLIKTYKHSKRHLFAVADGHGPNGHLVSQFISSRLETHLLQQPRESLVNSFSETYSKIQHELYLTNLFDVSLSGSTLLSVVLDYPKLVCANVGDSRAVLVRKHTFNWEVVHISEDHKPSIPKERKRILKKGGKIHAFKDEQGFSVGPLRVWLPNKNLPGLAMSRSLGDNLSKGIGVTHEPEVVELEIEAEDKFVILGSDGVWESITSTQVLNFLVPLFNQGKMEQCCDTLLQLCLSSSLTKPLDPIDDITFILIFLNKPG